MQLCLLRGQWSLRQAPCRSSHFQDLVWWLTHSMSVLNCLVVSNFCDPMDCSPPVFCPWDFPGKSTRAGCHFFLQGIFPTQGSNLHLLHWRVDSLPLSHLGSPLTHSRSSVNVWWRRQEWIHQAVKEWSQPSISRAPELTLLFSWSWPNTTLNLWSESETSLYKLVSLTFSSEVRSLCL